MMRFAAAALMLAGCAAPAAEAQDRVRARIEVVFAPYEEAEGAGYVIGVVRGGELVFAEGYGYADIERRIPLTPDTPMNLASLSKQFTAASIALEVTRGRLNLDDRLRQHWPGLPVFLDDVSIAHLVYMTSGVPEYYELPHPRGLGWSSEDGFTVDDALAAIFASDGLQFEPGSRWAYSNSNYQLLAELVARLNGVTFAAHMESTFFEPLSMRATWVDAPIDAGRADRALAYQRTELGWREAPRRSPHYGGSGVFASLRDLARWDAALYRDEAFGRRFSDLMLSTRRFAHDKANDAFGLVHGEYRGLATVWYEGGDYGVSTYMVRLPARDETVICLSNIGEGGCAEKARAVVDILLEERP